MTSGTSFLDPSVLLKLSGQVAKGRKKTLINNTRTMGIPRLVLEATPQEGSRVLRWAPTEAQTRRDQVCVVGSTPKLSCGKPCPRPTSSVAPTVPGDKGAEGRWPPGFPGLPCPLGSPRVSKGLPRSPGPGSGKKLVNRLGVSSWAKEAPCSCPARPSWPKQESERRRPRARKQGCPHPRAEALLGP